MNIIKASVESTVINLQIEGSPLDVRLDAILLLSEKLLAGALDLLFSSLLSELMDAPACDASSEKGQQTALAAVNTRARALSERSLNLSRSSHLPSSTPRPASGKNI